MINDLSFVRNVESGTTLPALLYGVFPVVWIVIFSSLSIYDGRKFLRAADEIAALFLSTIIASISSAGILYLSYRDVSRALFIVFIISAFLACLLWRILIRFYFRVEGVSTKSPRQILIVGAGPLGQSVSEQLMRMMPENMTLAGFISDGYENVDGIEYLGELEDLKDLVQKHNITDVVIALPYSVYNKMSDIVLRLDELPVGVWIALGFFDLALYRTNIEDFAGIPMLDLRASAMDDYQRMIKRAFDVFFCFIAIVPALLLMGLSAVLIVLEDGFPILFRQKRVGENGRLFEMFKFRTMVRNAEQLKGQVEKRDAGGNLVHKSRYDPRVTRIGRLLRRLSMDELPQIFNILSGTMSLVGPRPEMPYLVDKYQPWQRKRFAVPPGLTGWWQVNGRSDRPMHLHTEDDLFYIQNYSIWLDIQIIFRTIWMVLIGKGAY